MDDELKDEIRGKLSAINCEAREFGAVKSKEERNQVVRNLRGLCVEMADLERITIFMEILKT